MRLPVLCGTFGAALVAATLVGCGGGNNETAGGGPTGTVVVDGSSTVFPISKAAQLGYAKVRGRDVKVLVGNHGTGGGFGRYLQGEVDIVDASREAKPTEEEQAKEKGYEWTRFLVGYDGITVVTNPANTWAKTLTVEQLKRTFEPNSTVKTWKDLDPSWPDRQIVIYAPDNDSGTFEFFTEAIIGEKEQRKDIQVSPDDNILVKGVSGDEGGPGVLRLRLLRGEQGTPQRRGRAERPGRRAGPAQPRDDPRAGVHAAVPPAVPLRQECVDGEAGHGRLPALLHRAHRDAGHQGRLRPADGRGHQAENLKKLPGGTDAPAEAVAEVQ